MGAFDFDQSVTNSVLQYNYSHDNYGPFMALFIDYINGMNAWGRTPSGTMCPNVILPTTVTALAEPSALGSISRMKQSTFITTRFGK